MKLISIIGTPNYLMATTEDNATHMWSSQDLSIVSVPDEYTLIIYSDVEDFWEGISQLGEFKTVLKILWLHYIHPDYLNNIFANATDIFDFKTVLSEKSYFDKLYTLYPNMDTGDVFTYEKDVSINTIWWGMQELNKLRYLVDVESSLYSKVWTRLLSLFR